MNKQELIAQVAEVTGKKKNETEEIINTLFTTIGEILAKGEKVMIAGYLNFDVKPTDARIGRNPKTGETVNIAAGRKVTVKVMKKLKDAVK